MSAHDSDARRALEQPITRRKLLAAGAIGGVGLATGGSALALQTRGASPAEHATHHDMMAVGDIRPGAFDPTAYLTQFDYGRESRLPGGQVLREYELVAEDREIEVAPGVFYPAWTYNGQVPGPTIRCTEGDRIRVRFVNRGRHPHSVHFHGIHAANMDGAFEMVPPDGSYTYEFDAEPAGLQLYHCHTVPIKRHIHKGLYGVFIIDPPGGRPPARELVMMMNAFDTNFDNENEVYAVNTVAFHYQKYPIQLRKGELTRVYLVNITEFDLLNSFHLHANFFHYYPTGTSLVASEFTDTIIQGQAQRCILEFSYKYPGMYMFHAHVTEFAELGWNGMFEVLP